MEKTPDHSLCRAVGEADKQVFWAMGVVYKELSLKGFQILLFLLQSGI